MSAVRTALQTNRLVVLRDAFQPAFADRMHKCLDALEDWQVFEGGDGHFRFHHHNIYDRERFPPDLAWCESIFGSEPTRRLVADWSDRDCSGPATFSASRYLPGDFSLAHSDFTGAVGGHERQVAFTWHLALDWREDWGGDLYWGPAQRSFSPSFNTLFLFGIDRHNRHSVSNVSPFATGKRLAISGWWTGVPAGEAAPSAPRPQLSRVEVV